jgi:DNA-binding IclR family transcriptional regulator
VLPVNGMKMLVKVTTLANSTVSEVLPSLNKAGGTQYLEFSSMYRIGKKMLAKVSPRKVSYKFF